MLAIFTADLVMSHGGFLDADALAFGFAAVILSGLVQIAFGAIRMGRVIEFIPYPVITGFMSGIALLILWTGVKDVLDPTGATLTDAQGLSEAGAFFAGASASHVYVAALLALVAFALTFGYPRLARRFPEEGRFWKSARVVPGSILALVVVTAIAIAWAPAQGVTHVKALPQGLPTPFTSWDFLLRHPEWLSDLAIGAIGLALISSIDTLLTCVIADSVVGTRHKSNRELVAQGVGNTLAGLFHGSQSCGAAVRTMVNVKNGGRTRLSGMFHAVVLVLILFAGASFATLIPIAVLSGILIVTGIGMVEWHAIFTAHKAPKSDTVVMLVTIVATLAFGLVEAVVIGVVLAALLFMKRMAELTDFVVDAQEDEEERRRWAGFGKAVVVYEIRGPLFFGAANRFAQTLQRAGGALDSARVVVFKMHSVAATDETGMRTFTTMLDRFDRLGVRVLIVGLPSGPFGKWTRFGLVDRVGRDAFFATTSEALATAHRLLRGGSSSEAYRNA